MEAQKSFWKKRRQVLPRTATMEEIAVDSPAPRKTAKGDKTLAANSNEAVSRRPARDSSRFTTGRE